jgi:hypothetical protein
MATRNSLKQTCAVDLPRSTVKLTHQGQVGGVVGCVGGRSGFFWGGAKGGVGLETHCVKGQGG